MGLEDAISTEEIRANLMKIRLILPDQDETTYQFGEYLAERLTQGRIVPEGFYMAAKLALYDLEKGVNGFTNQPIHSHLVGYPTQIYSLIALVIPELAKATCPSNFAEGVKNMDDAVREKF